MPMPEGELAVTLGSEVVQMLMGCSGVVEFRLDCGDGRRYGFRGHIPRSYLQRHEEGEPLRFAYGAWGMRLLPPLRSEDSEPLVRSRPGRWPVREAYVEQQLEELLDGDDARAEQLLDLLAGQDAPPDLFIRTVDVLHRFRNVYTELEALHAEWAELGQQHRAVEEQKAADQAALDARWEEERQVQAAALRRSMQQLDLMRQRGRTEWDVMRQNLNESARRSIEQLDRMMGVTAEAQAQAMGRRYVPSDDLPPLPIRASNLSAGPVSIADLADQVARMTAALTPIISEWKPDVIGSLPHPEADEPAEPDERTRRRERLLAVIAERREAAREQGRRVNTLEVGREEYELLRDVPVMQIGVVFVVSVQVDSTLTLYWSDDPPF